MEVEIPAPETKPAPAFFLHEVHEYTGEQDTAYQQIFDSDGSITRNPGGGLRIDELYVANEGAEQDVTDIIVIQRDNHGGESIYERGEVVSEPYFGADNLWWIDVEMKDYEGKPFRVPRCLAIWGVTRNDNREWNPYFYVLPAD